MRINTERRRAALRVLPRGAAAADLSGLPGPRGGSAGRAAAYREEAGAGSRTPRRNLRPSAADRRRPPSS